MELNKATVPTNRVRSLCHPVSTPALSAVRFAGHLSSGSPVHPEKVERQARAADYSGGSLKDAAILGRRGGGMVSRFFPAQGVRPETQEKSGAGGGSRTLTSR